mgnify:CR=1 FL=1
MYQVFISYKKRISLQKSRRNAIHIYYRKDLERAYISRTGGSCYHNRYYNMLNIISNDRGKTVNYE